MVIGTYYYVSAYKGGLPAGFSGFVPASSSPISSTPIAKSTSVTIGISTHLPFNGYGFYLQQVLQGHYGRLVLRYCQRQRHRPIILLFLEPSCEDRLFRPTGKLVRLHRCQVELNYCRFFDHHCVYNHHRVRHTPFKQAWFLHVTSFTKLFQVIHALISRVNTTSQDLLSTPGTQRSRLTAPACKRKNMSALLWLNCLGVVPGLKDDTSENTASSFLYL